MTRNLTGPRSEVIEVAARTNGAQDLSSWRVERDFAKRSFDIAFSVVVLLAASPIFVVIALAILLTSRGGVIYRKPVLGRGGREVQMLKFRTMYVDADQRLAGMLDTDAVLAKEWEQTQKLKADPRITTVGRVLRRLSLDELPQFWNVLRADLSVVGPRPYFKDANLYSPVQFQAFLKSAPTILSVRPGITGMWATSGRARLSFADRIRLDEQYVEMRSPWVDFKLIAMTIPAVLSARGAY